MGIPLLTIYSLKQRPHQSDFFVSANFSTIMAKSFIFVLLLASIGCILADGLPDEGSVKTAARQDDGCVTAGWQDDGIECNPDEYCDIRHQQTSETSKTCDRCCPNRISI